MAVGGFPQLIAFGDDVGGSGPIVASLPPPTTTGFGTGSWHHKDVFIGLFATANQAFTAPPGWTLEFFYGVGTAASTGASGVGCIWKVANKLDCTLTAAGDKINTNINGTAYAHGRVAGEAVRFTTTGSLAGTGLATGTTYFVTAGTINANDFQVSDTLAHALAGTNVVDITGAGTGTHTCLDYSPTIAETLNCICGNIGAYRGADVNRPIDKVWFGSTTTVGTAATTPPSFSTRPGSLFLEVCGAQFSDASNQAGAWTNTDLTMPTTWGLAGSTDIGFHVTTGVGQALNGSWGYRAASNLAAGPVKSSTMTWGVSAAAQVWASIVVNPSTPTYRGFTAPTSGFSVTSPTTTEVGDLVVVSTFERTSGSSPPTHTPSGSASNSDTSGLTEASSSARLSTACFVATAAGAQSYTGFTSSDGTGTVRTSCVVYARDTFDVANVKYGTAAGDTSANPPGTGTGMPPVTTGSNAHFDVLVVGGWRLSASASVTPTAPAAGDGSSYDLITEVSGSADVELAVSRNTYGFLDDNDSIAPPAYTSSGGTITGTCAMTIAIPGKYTASTSTAIASPYIGLADEKLNAKAWVDHYFVDPDGLSSFDETLVTGASTVVAVGTTSGSATCTAVGRSTAAATGSSAGAATCTAVGKSTAAATGTSTGTCTATAVGVALAIAAGSASGTATATAVGKSTAASAGSCTGSATCSGVGRSTAVAAGSVSGAATAMAVGASSAVAVGAAAGSATATAAGSGNTNSTGSCAGTTTCSGVGRSTAVAAGSVSGVATAAAVGASSSIATGTATGTATATAVGRSTAVSAGSSTGTATVTAAGESTAVASGAAAGTSTATAAGETSGSIGSCTGTSTCSGVGASTAVAAGSIAGTSTVAAVGRSTAESTGAASGTAVASGVGRSTAVAVGSAAGTSTVNGISFVAAPYGTAAGTSTATAVGASTAVATGVANGTSTALAESPSGGGFGINRPRSIARPIEPQPRKQERVLLFLRRGELQALSVSTASFDAKVRSVEQPPTEQQVSSSGFAIGGASTAQFDSIEHRSPQPLVTVTDAAPPRVVSGGFAIGSNSIASFDAATTTIETAVGTSSGFSLAGAIGESTAIGAGVAAGTSTARAIGQAIVAALLLAESESDATFDVAGFVATLVAFNRSDAAFAAIAHAITTTRPAATSDTRLGLQARAMGNQTAKAGSVISLDAYRRETLDASMRRLSVEHGVDIGVVVPIRPDVLPPEPPPRSDSTPPPSPPVAVQRVISLLRVRAKSGLKHEHRRRKVPAPRPTTLIETDYAQRIIGILDAQRAMLAPLLAEMPALRAGRTDEIRLDVGEGRRVRVFFDRVRDRIAGEAVRVAERAAHDIGIRVSSHGLADLNRQTMAALGIEIEIGDARLQKALEHFVHENVQLIRSLDARSMDDVEGMFLRALNNDKLAETLPQDLAARYGVHESHARLIARDQIGKLSGQLARDRHQEIGLTHFKWRKGAPRFPRPEHLDRAGNTYAYQGEGRPPTMPGEEILCQCYAEPVFDDLLEAINGGPRIPKTAADVIENKVMTLPARDIAARGYYELVGAGEDPVKTAKALRAVREGQRDAVTIVVDPVGRLEVTDGRHRLRAAIAEDLPVKVRFQRARHIGVGEGVVFHRAAL